MQIEDLIRYENENTRLDFKSTQYRKEQFEALIKDVMSMANSDVADDKYIIVGLKHQPNGEKEIIGIDRNEFIDVATYQQVIYENIEPELNLDYFSFEFEGNLLGILKICNCNDKPYMMKKDYKNLKKGDSFIRKGTHQMKMVRSDYVKIFETVKKQNVFEEYVKIQFESNNSDRIVLNAVKIGELPSQRAARRIESVLSEKRQISKEAIGLIKAFNISYNIGGSIFGKSYEEMTINELEKALKEIKNTYKQHDYYEYFEINSTQINFIALNESNQYIEDASIQIIFDKVQGVNLASRYYEEPTYENILLGPINYSPSFESLNYPTVEDNGAQYIVKENVGDIKHHIPVQVFKVSLRFVITSKKNLTLPLQIKLFGKNMSVPLERNLIIEINPIETQ